MSTTTYTFANGTFTIIKGITTKFDWAVSVTLNDGFIALDKSIFHTKRQAKETTIKLLQKFNLY